MWLTGTATFPLLISAPGEMLGSQEQLWSLMLSFVFCFFVVVVDPVQSGLMSSPCTLAPPIGFSHPLSFSGFYFILFSVLFLGPI